MTDPPSPFPFQPSLHPSLFLFLPTRIRENDSLSGNWNPVIYGARRGEDSWINVQVYRGGLAYRYLGKSRLSAEAEYLSIRGAISTAGVKIGMKIWWGKVWGDKWKFMTMSRRFWLGFNDELRFYRSKSVRTDLGKFNFDFWSIYGDEFLGIEIGKDSRLFSIVLIGRNQWIRWIVMDFLKQ